MSKTEAHQQPLSHFNPSEGDYTPMSNNYHHVPTTSDHSHIGQGTALNNLGSSTVSPSMSPVHAEGTEYLYYNNLPASFNHQQQQESLMLMQGQSLNIMTQSPTYQHQNSGSQQNQHQSIASTGSAATSGYTAVLVRNQGVATNSIDQHMPMQMTGGEDTIDETTIRTTVYQACGNNVLSPYGTFKSNMRNGRYGSSDFTEGGMILSTELEQSIMMNRLDFTNSPLPDINDPNRKVDPFKSPKVSSLYRNIEQQRLINKKLPNQIYDTQKLFNQTLQVLGKHDISAEFPLKKRISQKNRERQQMSVDVNDGPNTIFHDKYEFKKTKLKTLLDKLSQSYNVAGKQTHFVNAIDSMAAIRYIDDAQLKAKEMILKQNKIYYNVLKRDIRRPEHILNRDPLDNNFNRMGLIEKREEKLLRLQQQTASSGLGGMNGTHASDKAFSPQNLNSKSPHASHPLPFENPSEAIINEQTTQKHKFYMTQRSRGNAIGGSMGGTSRGFLHGSSNMFANVSKQPLHSALNSARNSLVFNQTIYQQHMNKQPIDEMRESKNNLNIQTQRSSNGAINITYKRKEENSPRQNYVVPVTYQQIQQQLLKTQMPGPGINPQYLKNANGNQHNSRVPVPLNNRNLRISLNYNQTKGNFSEGLSSKVPPLSPVFQDNNYNKSILPVSPDTQRSQPANHYTSIMQGTTFQTTQRSTNQSPTQILSPQSGLQTQMLQQPYVQVQNNSATKREKNQQLSSNQVYYIPNVQMPNHFLDQNQHLNNMHHGPQMTLNQVKVPLPIKFASQNKLPDPTQSAGSHSRQVVPRLHGLGTSKIQGMISQDVSGWNTAQTPKNNAPSAHTTLNPQNQDTTRQSPIVNGGSSVVQLNPIGLASPVINNQ